MSEVKYLKYKLQNDWKGIHETLMDESFQQKYSTLEAASQRYKEVVLHDLSTLSLEDKTLVFLIKGYPYSIVIVEMLLRR